jgi:hypothetical protein
VIASDKIISGKNLITPHKNGFVVPLNNHVIKPLLDEIFTFDSFDAAVESAKHNTLERMADEHLSILKEIHRG